MSCLFALLFLFGDDTPETVIYGKGARYVYTYTRVYRVYNVYAPFLGMMEHLLYA